MGNRRSAWLRFEMVTVEVQRCPIPDYFMAYFLEHPEGNANCSGQSVGARRRRAARNGNTAPMLLSGATAPPSTCLSCGNILIVTSAASSLKALLLKQAPAVVFVVSRLQDFPFSNTFFSFIFSYSSSSFFFWNLFVQHWIRLCTNMKCAATNSVTFCPTLKELYLSDENSGSSQWPRSFGISAQLSLHFTPWTIHNYCMLCMLVICLLNCHAKQSNILLMSKVKKWHFVISVNCCSHFTLTDDCDSATDFYSFART